MRSMSWSAWANAELATVRAAQRWRETVAFDGAGPRGTVHGRDVVSFASNDYLGLSAHPQVRAAAIEAINTFGAGAGASRLVAGTRTLHLNLEDTLARWQHAERALVFPTGYAANLAVLSVFGADNVTIFSDELNHASIIDGCRLSKARVDIYRHLDLDYLATRMRAARGRKIVVSDSVFSMDGDVAPLTQLAALCAQHGALLVIDEAHAVLEPVLQWDQCDVLRVGTLSKALGSQGGWVAGSRALIELLNNRARAFIFTTALSPADTAAALAALRIVMGDEGGVLRETLHQRIDILRPWHRSPILPLIIGADQAALDAAAHLLAQGILVPAIRPPSVPIGTSRLRIALSAAHSIEMVEQLKEALVQLPCNLLAQKN
ncbi:MAG: 8-amino-7-oxononanoate synthase [Candidatus Obscuribacterales bacterium]|nr:8-amino-7-oxononanoate synthase [Steroidobacteraceae bacterium]